MNVYSLNDLYTMFREAAAEDRVPLLRYWSTLNLDYDIKWDNLIRAWGG